MSFDESQGSKINELKLFLLFELFLLQIVFEKTCYLLEFEFSSLKRR